MREKKLPPTEYLYNCSPTEFASLPYQEALEVKMEKARELLRVLVDVPLKDRDLRRISEVADAMRFNRELLDELRNSL